MARRNPTASGLERAEACPGSEALPHVDETSDLADSGHARHAYLERVPQVGADAALAEVPEEHREAAAAIDLEGLPVEGGYLQEFALAYDLGTHEARILSIARRDYGELGPREICGTADVASANAMSAVVHDYKFQGGEDKVTPPSRNLQLGFLGLALARLRGLQEATVGLIHLRPDGSHWQESATLDAFDLDSLDLRLAALLDGVARARAVVASGKVPDVHRGKWCRWCPAAAACPAVTSLVRAVAMEPAKTADEILVLLTPDTAAKAYARLQEVQDALKPVASALYLYASEHEIALPDGRVYGSVTTEREELDARVARQALAALYGPSAAESACDFETSKAAVQRALRAVHQIKRAGGEKVTLKSINDEALSAIRAAGGVSTKSKMTVREHRAGSKE